MREECGYLCFPASEPWAAEVYSPEDYVTGTESQRKFKPADTELTLKLYLFTYHKRCSVNRVEIYYAYVSGILLG